MLFVCYPNCSTCRKAQAWLTEQNVTFEVRDIKADRPTVEELKRWHQASGLPLRKLFNTSGMAYRELGLKDKLDTMSEEEQYTLLASDGMLVKRPILVSETLALFGFKEKEWADQILPNI